MRESLPQPSSNQEDWDAILAEEGMPAEPERAANDNERSPAYNTAVAELFRYYVTTETEDHGAHRHQLELLRDRMKSAGGTDEEMEEFDEDFARHIEDEVTDLELEAVRCAQEVAKERPMLAGRPNAMAKLITRKLKTGENRKFMKPDILMVIAERASATIH